MNKSTVFLTCIIGLSGCSTLHIDRGIDGQVVKTIEHQHRALTFDLYELDDPIDLNRMCGDLQWISIKTEKTFSNTLASTFGSLLVPGGWFPRSVIVYCSHAK